MKLHESQDFIKKRTQKAIAHALKCTYNSDSSQRHKGHSPMREKKYFAGVVSQY